MKTWLFNEPVKPGKITKKFFVRIRLAVPLIIDLECFLNI